MKQFIARIILIALTVIGASGTVYSIIQDYNILYSLFLIVLLIFICIYLFILEYAAYNINRPTVCYNIDQILKEMRKIINKRGRTKIISRDLSWVDTYFEDILSKKSRNGDLILVMEKETAVSKRLSKAGAEIIYYGSLGIIPTCRFTITGYGRDGSEVYIGRTKGDDHIIERFSSGHTGYALATDLAEILKVVR